MGAPQRRRADAPKSPPPPRKNERRRQILAAAKQLFVMYGYRASTVEQIAVAAEVSPAVLRRHFDGKRSLFLEVLKEVRAATLDRWAADTAALADPLARLHAIADLYVGAAREQAVEFRAVHRALVEAIDEEVAGALRAFYLDCETFLAEIITAGQQAGVFRRSLEPRVGAWELIHTALGYTLTLPLAIPLYEEPDYVARAVDCMLHCLLKTDV